MQPFVIRKDARGALVHVRRKDTGECLGCIEAGLFEIVKAVIVEEATASTWRAPRSRPSGRRS